MKRMLAKAGTAGQRGDDSAPFQNQQSLYADDGYSIDENAAYYQPQQPRTSGNYNTSSSRHGDQARSTPQRSSRQPPQQRSEYRDDRNQDMPTPRSLRTYGNMAAAPQQSQPTRQPSLRRQQQSYPLAYPSYDEENFESPQHSHSRPWQASGHPQRDIHTTPQLSQQRSKEGNSTRTSSRQARDSTSRRDRGFGRFKRQDKSSASHTTDSNSDDDDDDERQLYQQQQQGIYNGGYYDSGSSDRQAPPNSHLRSTSTTAMSSEPHNRNRRHQQMDAEMDRSQSNQYGLASSAYQSYGQSNEFPSSSGGGSSSDLQYYENQQQQQQSGEQKKRGLWHGLGRKPRGSGDLMHDESPDSSAYMEQPYSDKSAQKSKGSVAGLLENKAKGLRSAWLEGMGLGPEARGPPKELDGEVTAKIGWLCSPQSSASDWANVFELASLVGSEDLAAKEAVRALRKELKLGEPDMQKKAVKLWAILVMYSNDKFRKETATKHFLEVPAGLLADSKASLGVKEKILDAWGMLASQFQYDPDLSNITKMYNKSKPRDRPLNGESLDMQHEIFRLPTISPAQTHTDSRQRRLSQGRGSDSHSSGLRMQSVGSDAAPQNPQYREPSEQLKRRSQHPQYTPPQTHSQRESPIRAQLDNQGRAPPRLPQKPSQKMQQPMEMSAVASSAPAEPPPKVIAEDEDARRLSQECEIARSNSNLLIDVITNEGLDSDEITEFRDRVCKSHMLLTSQVQWASAQADRSRRQAREVRNGVTDGVGHQRLDSVPETSEEMLLANILDATQQLSAALSILEEAEKDAAEQEEERRVKELSKTEYRVDRSMLRQDPQTGEIYLPSTAAPQGNSTLWPPSDYNINAGASGSRTHSPQLPSQSLPAMEPSAAASTGVPYTFSGVPGTLFQPTPMMPSQSKSSSNPRHSGGASARVVSGGSGSSGHSHASSIRAMNPAAAAAQSQSRAPLPQTPLQNVIITATTNGTGEGKAARRSVGSDSEESTIVTPQRPSEKALGKRRAVSGDEGTLGFAPLTSLGSASAAAAAATTGSGINTSSLSTSPPPSPPSAPRTALQESMQTLSLGSNGHIHSSTLAYPSSLDQQAITSGGAMMPPRLPPVPLEYQAQAQSQAQSQMHSQNSGMMGPRALPLPQPPSASQRPSPAAAAAAAQSTTTTTPSAAAAAAAIDMQQRLPNPFDR